MNSIFYYNANQHKYKSYAIDFNNSNFENDLNTAIVDTYIEEDHINSGCVYNKY